MGQETPPVAQDFLTDTEIERLREIQELSERGKDEEAIRAEAWSDLSDPRGYGVSDLEAFIDAASERRIRLSERYSETYSEKMPTTSNFVSAVSEQEMTRQWAKKEASEEMYQFRKQTIPLTQKLRRLRVRMEVAEEILDRRLYGYEVPNLPPDEEDRLVTPLSEYDPAPKAKKVLETVVEHQEKIREMSLSEAFTYLDDDLGLIHARANLRKDMRGEEKAASHYPGKGDDVEKLLELAREVAGERSQTFANRSNPDS
ncbi:hypothetical protein [Salinibacter ruber]|uniref:hypothetical protein n=1 Tax=Salinibacter ruber TaxID=146919 RepID=UPI000E57D703|nr:hypothetical protein [Salinibacter ruber]